MVKEIQVRVWDKTLKKMIYLDTVDWETRHNYFIEENYIPLLFIGLQDKNGKEIYEGDIISNCRYGNIKIVEWNYLRTGFAPFSNSVHWEESEKVKVIGNIYENPELFNNKE